MAQAFSASGSSWGRRTLFVASLVLHGVGAAALVAWSLLHVEELPPPEVTLTFFNAPPPPPPPSDPAAAPVRKKAVLRTRRAAVKKRSTREPASPREEPPPPEEPKEEPRPSAEPDGLRGGLEGGGGSPPSPPPPPPPPPAPVGAARMVPTFLFEKERIAAPNPHLPDDFKDRHQKETVTATYRICVGTNGRVYNVSVVRGIGGNVDDFVIRQIRATWLYKPQPVPVCALRVFAFRVD